LSDVEAVDFADQIRALRRCVGGWSGVQSAAVAASAEQRASTLRRWGLRAGTATGGDVVVGEAVAAEVGRPPAPSVALVLPTRVPGLVSDGRASWVGCDLDRAPPGCGLPLAQVVLVEHRLPAPDMLQLESLQRLTDRLPGVMTRAVPERLWLRVDRQRIAAGFRLQSLAAALICSYHLEIESVRAVEVVLATGDADDRDARWVRSLEPLRAEWQVLAGRHKKLTLVAPGVYECEDLDCASCEDKSVCDALREITIRYRQEGP